MRKLIILLFFILPWETTPAVAQPYQSMFGSGDKASTSWVFKWSNLWGNTTDSAYVEKDTVVNGISYKKISIKAVGGVGLLREDVNSGIVWYRDIEYSFMPEDTIDREAFRFDLKVGDTFDISNKDRQPGTYPVTDNIVDSTKYINGVKHIYFRGKFSHNEPITIIEGIGSNMGVLWKHYYGIMLGQYLLCSYKNGIKTPFVNNLYNGACLVAGNVDELKNDIAVLIYPQPTSKVVNIKNSTTEKINKIQIISQTGQLVKEVTSLEITSVEIEEIPAGYYYLKLHTGNGYVTVKPMVVR